MSRLTPILVVAAAALWLGVEPANAQNLLINPDFDTDLSGWTPSGPVTWDGTMDADGSPTSGSAATLATIPSGLGSSNAGPTQCVPVVTAGMAYEFGGNVFIAQAPPAGGVRITVIWRSNPGCSTPTISLDSTPSATTIGGWEPVSTTAIAPPGAVSAFVQIVEAGGGTAGDFALNVDDLFLQAGTPVPTMNTVWLLAIAGVLIAISVWMMGRRHRISAGA